VQQHEHSDAPLNAQQIMYKRFMYIASVDLTTRNGVNQIGVWRMESSETGYFTHTA